MSTNQSPRLRPALPAEANLLTDLALRSKAYWGYSAEFMEACRAELTLDAAYVQTNPTVVIESEAGVVGFYALEHLSDQAVELGYLFVDPLAIGQGFGRRLITHAKQHARALGYRRLVIQGDPHAERFYRAAGGQVVGSKESASVPGRTLPLFHVELREKLC
ncbi:MAG: GNAT family N-acetyltransferase [Anaerolineae bacterium]|nr:GNAT family N-acetyltransferase [Anaerolineae bacterium]